ncbi:MAG: AAA family ATPase [Planctomycetes bacterium]|nr:AAA family ATPase [Planctomycetota bacterium]
MTDSRLITKVVLKNYKSIAFCDVPLGPLMFLVGPNGAGKSNFLDALRLVADSLRNSLETALRERGGFQEVGRRSGGRPNDVWVRIELSLREGQRGHYAFRIAAREGGAFYVKEEECVVLSPGPHPSHASFRVKDGNVVSTSFPSPPPALSDHLYLLRAAGLPEFRPVHAALSRMAFYNLSPDEMKKPQQPGAGDILERQGKNLPSVLGQMTKQRADVKERIEEYLAAIVPGLNGVRRVPVGPLETLEFRQQGPGEDPWRFYAINMSDGTLRALGVLVALFQPQDGTEPPVPLVGIEEPELALHPAAAGALRDCLREASACTQVLVTSHSPDLLDDPETPTESLLAVCAEEGLTRIAPLGGPGRAALRERLFTAGELLRMNQLAPDPEASREPPLKQQVFFAHEQGS